MLPSIVRTLVPVLVGLFGPWLTNHVGLTDVQVTGTLTAAVTVAYYLTVRAAEQVAPTAGILLGWAQQPSYGRHEAGRPRVDDVVDAALGRREAGSARVAIVMAVLVAASLALLVSAVSRAHAAGPYRTPVQPHVVSVRVCDNAVWATFTLRRQVGRQMVDVLDDGSAQLQLLRVGARYGPGQWQTITPDRRTEGMLGWSAYRLAGNRHGVQYVQARVVTAQGRGVISVPAPIVEGCAP